MTEQDIQVIEVEIYGYFNKEGQKVFTPNLEFAHIMARKYDTEHVYVERK
jgi:hypothetical protein